MKQQNIRLRSLKRQRFALGLFVGLEGIAALTLIVQQIAERLVQIMDILYKLVFGPPLSQVESFLLRLDSEYLFIYFFFIILPFLCLVLLGLLLWFGKLNRKKPVIGKLSLWALLFGMLLPLLAAFFSSIEWFSQWYTTVSSLCLIWVLIGILPVNFLLIRNLWQYTRAIRLEAQNTVANEPHMI